jgi:hypothetical protein
MVLRDHGAAIAPAQGAFHKNEHFGFGFQRNPIQRVNADAGNHPRSPPVSLVIVCVHEENVMDISGTKVAILATNGFEQSELEIPRDRLKAAGAMVDVIAPGPGQIRGWDRRDWGRTVPVDRTLGRAKADDYDVIVLPGGQINPDLLRTDARVLNLVRAFHDQRKTVAAICHAPWLLIETGLAKGRRRHPTSRSRPI